MRSSLWEIENKGGESMLLFQSKLFPSLGAIQCVISMRWLLFSFLEME